MKKNIIKNEIQKELIQASKQIEETVEQTLTDRQKAQIMRILFSMAVQVETIKRKSIERQSLKNVASILTEFKTMAQIKRFIQAITNDTWRKNKRQKK